MNTSVSRWHEALSNKLNIIGFLPSKAYPDLWMQDSRYHNEYITVKSGDLIIFSKDPTGILRVFNTLFPLKGVVKTEFHMDSYVVTV